MRSFILLSFIIFTFSCRSDSGDTKNKAHFRPYVFDNIMIQKDVIYGTEDTTQQVMDIYLHGQRVGEPKWMEIDTSLHKTLIYIHGGGWLGGDKSDNIFQFVPFLEEGFNLFSLNYRMGVGTAPDAAEDVICALRWIVDGADQYQLDTENIYITGGSAGGHLALVSGFAPTSDDTYQCDVSDIRIRGIINQFGITEIEKTEKFLSTYKPDWNYPSAWIGDMERMGKISQKYSPVYMVNENVPPVITIHGSVDSVVPYAQSHLLENVLKEKGVYHKLVTIEGGNHGGFGDKGWDLMMKESFDFINSIEKGSIHSN